MQQLRRKPARFLYGCIALVLGACAQITAPTGGPRDTEPPKVIRELPSNLSTNVEGKSIDIEFDEFVQVLNPQAIVVSPATDPQPDFVAKKNQLHIKFKNELDTNTTYSIFFGNAIGDNNENNKLDNYSYVFSTGKYLDSLKLKANVIAADGDIPDNSYLLLYRETDDSAFLKHRPFYLTKIEKNGSAELGQLKAGRYAVYALSDKNLNYYYDLPSEHIGFLDSAIIIQDSLLSLMIPIFLPEERRLRITEFDKKIQGGIFRMTFNKPLSPVSDEIRVLVAEDTTWNTAAFQEADNKQVKVYLPSLPADSSSYTLLIRHNGQLIDSLRLRCDSRVFTQPARFFTDTNALKNLVVLETQPLKIRSSYYAMTAFDTSRIMLFDSTGVSLPFQAIRDTDLCTYLFYADWKDRMNYRLELNDSAFSDLAGNYNARQIIAFSGSTRKKAGQLILNIELPHIRNQAIVLLKDVSGKLIRQWITSGAMTVRLDAGLLNAGTYQVDVINDTNNNGIWNSGNYAGKTLPEKIFSAEKPILIKENWDAEETIQVDYTQVKKAAMNILEKSPTNERPNSPLLQQNPGKRPIKD